MAAILVVIYSSIHKYITYAVLVSELVTSELSRIIMSLCYKL